MSKVLFAALSLFIVSFASCSDDEDNGGTVTPSKVVEEVLAQFEKDYPNASDVTWYVTKDDFAIAEYNLPATTRASEVIRKYKSWYKNQKDLAEIRFMDEEDITYEALPTEVKAAFEASEYADQAIWTVDDVEVIKRHKLDPIYSIEVESEDLEVDLYYDQLGTLVKIIVDADDSYNKHQGLIVDQELPEAITSFLDTNHKDYRLIDIDVEEDELDEIEESKAIKHWEIEIVDNKVKKELIFTYDDSKWLYTEWEVEGEDLPTAIANTIKDKYADFKLDDEKEFDMIDHNEKNLLYKVELEYTGSEDKKDLLVYFDEKGEVVLEVED